MSATRGKQTLNCYRIKMRLVWVGFVLSLLALGSCGSAVREETPAYFDRVTGLKLCDGATVRNKNDAATPDAGLGVVYIVSVKMSAACKADFLRQVDAMRRKISPNGYPTDDTSIFVEDRGREVLVTYTT